MADTGWFEVSGSGFQLLDSGAQHAVQYLEAHVGTITSAKVRILPGGDPRRIQFGGSVFLGGTATDHNGDTVNEGGLLHNLQLEREFWFPPTTPIAQAVFDRVNWRLPPGITWWLLVAW